MITMCELIYSFSSESFCCFKCILKIIWGLSREGISNYLDTSCSDLSNQAIFIFLTNQFSLDKNSILRSSKLTYLNIERPPNVMFSKDYISEIIHAVVCNENTTECDEISTSMLRVYGAIYILKPLKLVFDFSFKYVFLFPEN